MKQRVKAILRRVNMESENSVIGNNRNHHEMIKWPYSTCAHIYKIQQPCVLCS